MTFPSSLIASIQFISASHARPQSIKHALLQRSSCPIITPIIKSAGIMGKAQPDDGRNKQVFNSGRKQIKASHSTIRLESRNTGALAQTEVWVSLHVQQVQKSDSLSLGHHTCHLKTPGYILSAFKSAHPRKIYWWSPRAPLQNIFKMNKLFFIVILSRLKLPLYPPINYSGSISGHVLQERTSTNISRCLINP